MGSSCIRLLLSKREKKKEKNKLKKRQHFLQLPLLDPLPLVANMHLWCFWLFYCYQCYPSYHVLDVLWELLFIQDDLFFIFIFGPFDRNQHASKREANNCHSKYGVRMDDVMKLRAHLSFNCIHYYLLPLKEKTRFNEYYSRVEKGK